MADGGQAKDLGYQGSTLSKHSVTVRPQSVEGTTRKEIGEFGNQFKREQRKFDYQESPPSLLGATGRKLIARCTDTDPKRSPFDLITRLNEARKMTKIIPFTTKEESYPET